MFITQIFIDCHVDVQGKPEHGNYPKQDKPYYIYTYGISYYTSIVKIKSIYCHCYEEYLSIEMEINIPTEEQEVKTASFSNSAGVSIFGKTSGSYVKFEINKDDILLAKDIFYDDDVSLKYNEDKIKFNSEWIFLIRRYLYLFENHDALVAKYMYKINEEKEIRAELEQNKEIYENGYKSGLREEYTSYFNLNLPYNLWSNDIAKEVVQELFDKAEKDGRAEFERRIRNSTEFTAREKEAIIKKEIFIGMSEKALLKSRGKPSDINTSVGSWGTHKQYVYGTYKSGNTPSYVYVENGKVTSWQY